MKTFIEYLRESLVKDEFVQLVLSSAVRTMEPTTTKLVVRPIEISGVVMVQMTRQNGKQQTHDNFPIEEGIGVIESLFGSHFRHAHLFTTSIDVTAKQKASGKSKLFTSPASKTTPEKRHNRRKAYLIPEGTPCPFLEAIGVMNGSGKVLSSRFDKFKQVNRFLEFVDDVYKTLPKTGCIRVVDFGCGKSYLTFAIHHLLVNLRGREVEMIGVDLKDSVIADCQAIAERLDCRGLKFMAADIHDVDPGSEVDLVVSLHACDTATDLALARAVAWKARAILSAPCCHHEFASKMNRDLLPDVHAHGILHERFAELVTDAYRSKMLEAFGYKAQVIEFVDIEHTARNLLIRATRANAVRRCMNELDLANQMPLRLGIEKPVLEGLLRAVSV